MVRVVIEFDASANSSWLENSLENKNLLENLAQRAINEFARDWRRTFTFSDGFTTKGDLIRVRATPESSVY